MSIRSLRLIPTPNFRPGGQKHRQTRMKVRLLGLMALADRYELIAVRDECAACLQLRLTEANMATLLKVADLHQASAFYGDGQSGEDLTEMRFNIIMHEPVVFMFEHDKGDTIVSHISFSEHSNILTIFKQ